MGTKDVVFDEDQLNMIYEDQRSTLESLHEGGHDCVLLYACPPEHFGNEDIDDIVIRQEIMKLILKDANEE